MKTNFSEENRCHVALASDSNYFIGLRTAVLSLLHFNPSTLFVIHILEDGITTEVKKKFEDQVKEKSQNSILKYHAVDTNLFNNLHDLRGSKMQYARLLLPTLIEAPKIIYLDCDVLVFSGIEALWQTDLEGNLAAVVQDAELPKIDGDWPMDSEAPDEAYFNSGVMLIDMELWRKEGTQKQVLSILDQKADKCKFWDQTALNVVLLDRLKYLDEKFNFCAKDFSIKKERPVVLHYMSRDRIPWESLVDNDSFKVWYYFYANNVDNKIAQLRNYFFKKKYWKACSVRLRVKITILYHINNILLVGRKMLSQSLTSKKQLDHKLKLYKKRRREFVGSEAKTDKLIEVFIRSLEAKNKAL